MPFLVCLPERFTDGGRITSGIVVIDLGLATSAQRVIPEYTGGKQFDLLRGFLAGSRWLPVVVVSICLAFSAFFEMIEWSSALVLDIPALVRATAAAYVRSAAA